MVLNFDLLFSDLYDDLSKIDQKFLFFLKLKNQKIFCDLLSYRNEKKLLTEKKLSSFILELSIEIEEFISHLFCIQTIVSRIRQYHENFKPFFNFKRQFVQRYATKKYNSTVIEFETLDLKNDFHDIKQERIFFELYRLHENDPDFCERLAQYCAWAALTSHGQKKHRKDVLFKLPQKINYFDLALSLEKDERGYRFSYTNQKKRLGFRLTDLGLSTKEALNESYNCIKCHNQGKDSCSKGLNNDLKGCPLKQKISEMIALKEKGYNIASLAVITLDNPLVALTGNRICNDCVKSCIFQKQTPIQVPGVESNILKEVLNLPFGFEIYSLLTRWNPLNVTHPFPSNLTEKNVLIAGLGPSGLTLAHYLMQYGHTIVGIDGLKIEPLPKGLAARDENGDILFEPIYCVNDLFKSLENRVIGGVGGVLEYGITVRFDKNMILVVRLLLERRFQCKFFGGVRFGGTITVSDAFTQGFDHIALCMGAGSPTTLSIPNKLASNIRQASDFLMNLHLGGLKSDALFNFDIDLPAVVIGGGLTAIDTATEIFPYYCLQIEKFNKFYRAIIEHFGDDYMANLLSEKDKIRAKRWLNHFEEWKTISEISDPELFVQKRIEFLKQCQGVTVLYRNNLTDSPAYRLNTHEVDNAFKEGITFLECSHSLHFEVDSLNQVKGIVIEQQGERRKIDALSVFIACGTHANTSLRYDIKESELDLKNNQFKFIEGIDPCFLISLDDNKKGISVFGDQHPHFSGSVVKAMASAKQGAPLISNVLT